MPHGSEKDLGYFSLDAPRATNVVLRESAVNAISCFALYPWRLCISISRARPNPRWLPSLIRQGYEVYCGFDSDSIEGNMANAVIVIYPSVKRLRPTQHDWNDVLKSHSTTSLSQASA